MRLVAAISILLISAAIGATPQFALADGDHSSNYIVAFGASEIPGRVYDAQNDTTTFTYTVIGQGAAPEEYINKRLKAFKLELPVCEPEIELDSFSPDLEENDNPPFFAGPNPDIYAPEEDVVGFDFFGITWKGWHGEGALPVLVNPDEQRSFSVTFAGNLETGPLVAGTALISNDTGNFVTTRHDVPGVSCSRTCDNRVVLTFDDLSAGTTLTSQYESLGVTVTAQNATPGQLDEAAIFDTAQPLAGAENLGTPNVFYGGPGQPALNPVSGVGVGNLNSLRNALVVPNCALDAGKKSLAAACGAGSGSITLTFASAGQLVSAEFVDSNDATSRVIGRNASATVFEETIPASGSNGVQTVPFGHLNSAVTEVTFELEDAAAIDNIVLCLTPPPVPTPTPTPTPTPPPSCEGGDITEQQFRLDSNARQQKDLIKRLAKRLRRNANGKRQRKYARSVAQQAEALYLEAWNATWAMSSVFSKCENINEQCVTSNDYQLRTAELLADSNEFVELAASLNEQLRRARGGELRPRDLAIEKRVQSIDVSSQKEAREIPAQTVSCPETI